MKEEGNVGKGKEKEEGNNVMEIIIIRNNGNNNYIGRREYRKEKTRKKTNG